MLKKFQIGDVLKHKEYHRTIEIIDYDSVDPYDVIHGHTYDEPYYCYRIKITEIRALSNSVFTKETSELEKMYIKLIDFSKLWKEIND